MKKLLFAVFAHPDDEAFGPCGTLLREVESGTELHLFCLTRGEAGQNPDGLDDLGSERLSEWQKASELIGAFGRWNLKLRDGRLNNTTMILAQQQLLKIITQIIRSHKIPIEISFMTFNTNGLTGHIDHIVASRVSSYIFYHLKDKCYPVRNIWYYSLNETQQPRPSINWLFADKGYPGPNLTHIDATSQLNTIKAIIKTHHTQRDDGQKRLDDPTLGHEYFLVRD